MKQGSYGKVKTADGFKPHASVDEYRVIFSGRLTRYELLGRKTKN
jgi:hypothetical protein